MKKRATYSTPRLTAHGSVEKITKGGGGITAIDASFPAHTPINQLTFS
jgi:hypothetical protein